MAPRFSRLATGAAASALIAGLLMAAPASALASGGASNRCTGGPIAPGPYRSLVVSGQCLVVGPITVSGNLVIARGGALMAAFGGGDVTVGGNVIVHQQGIAVLGCEPGAFACLDDPDQTAPTLSASFQVRGNVIATGSLAVLLHNGRIGRTLTISGGGGGVNCDSQPALMGSPAYATVEDVSIGRNVSITGWRSCWLGLFRTTVGGNVNFTNNVVADPDGNEVATDTIAGNLTCSHNSPAPQVGDSGGAPNAVGGRATGQCAKLTN